MLTLGLVGHPIAGSLSPVMHEAALRHRGLVGHYARFDTEDPAPVFAALRAGAIDGLNVTVPHKLAAFAACDRRAPIAEQVGAVNTLVRETIDGRHRLVGWNTDLPGLMACILDAWAEPIEGVALVIGAGGAAPAAMLAARALGADEIRVWNRTARRAEELVASLGFGRVLSDRDEAAQGASLILQASSHGMGLAGAAQADAEREVGESIGRTTPDARVVDLVYRPRETAWVRAARHHGRRAIDGLEMLVHQAALAFELWTGARSEVVAGSTAAGELVTVMRRAALAALDPG